MQSFTDLSAKLELLATSQDASEDNRQDAEVWLDVLKKSQQQIENRKYSVVFLGKPGVGKSSALNLLTKLVIGDEKPHSKPDLIKQTVLSTGAGRTSICEVEIISSTKAGANYKLAIAPFSKEEIEEEIAFYARWEWQRYASREKENASSLEQQADNFSLEQQRGLRNLCDLAEYSETRLVNGQSRRVPVKPLEKHLQTFFAAGENKLEDFIRFLQTRARLDLRTTTEWEWPAQDTSLEEIKQQFSRLNLGQDPRACLPRKISLRLPYTLLQDAAIEELSLVDTRGLDGNIAGRQDLAQWLGRPDVIPVLCSGFKDAPDARARELLAGMENDARQQPNLAHTLLLLLDQGDAAFVTDADGDRERGKESKINECQEVLANDRLQDIQILALDVLQDDCGQLLQQIQTRIRKLREDIETNFKNQQAQASAFIQGWQNKRHAALKAEFDARLKACMAGEIPRGTPLLEPLQGLLNAIRDAHPASIVYASCLRKGEYQNLHAYSAIHKYAATSATAWVKRLYLKAQWELASMRDSGRFDEIKNHQFMRLLQIQNAPLQVSIDYAQSISSQVKELMQQDGNKIWQTCAEEWGRGGGFKQKVKENLENWARKQVRLDAHMSHTLYESFPLLADLKPKEEIPRFSLGVRNLRALREVDWQPEPMNLLIGANGSGKTTLILVLKLLQVAYERNLPEAIGQVLAGAHLLRSHGIPEQEMIEIGIDFGDLRWRLGLLGSGPSQLAAQGVESLHAGKEEIFSRNQLGQFTYRGQSIDNPATLGLRAVMDRGESSPAVRQLARLLQTITIHLDPDLYSLRINGSNSHDDRLLQTRGGNVFAVLRRWHEDKQERFRYDFVLRALKAAFPNLINDLDFDVAGNTVFIRVYRPGTEQATPISTEANGLLQMLVVLCAIASADKGSIVAFDEPENCLHPRAQMVLLRFAKRWGIQRQASIIFTTHSTVLLDEMGTDSESVFVMKARPDTQSVPVALNKLVNPEWLQGFKFGQLYEQGEIGSNEDE